MEELRRTVLEAPGTTPAELRRAVSELVDVPDALRGYVDKVVRHAYRVSDEEVDALKAAGYSEDQLFEITISAAVGAGLRRLEAGLAPLEGKL